ncbi:FG-GAP repeat protein [Nonomuraea harbinensis]|uniref:FG-GAP repeat protein n=1 Tax=Nonomuraea harbinensis TaxID=1286938 RepID=A0ABW1C2L8_9ACTN|nr:FG-GAP repeat protein [Nonomuraea harbinensis]
MRRRLGAWLVLILALPGCGAPYIKGLPTAAGHSASPPTPITASTPSTGLGSRRADDVNGDGYADLFFDFGSLGVVYGSPRGLDPESRTVLPVRDEQGLSAPAVNAFELLHTDNRADFDGDGFDDILLKGCSPVPSCQDRPLISWGGPRGLRTPTPTRVPLPKDKAVEAMVAGDFDGDGVGDVALAPYDGAGAWGEGKGSLMVLYGPFSRTGLPARHTSQPTSVDFQSFTADEIDGRRSTALVAGHAEETTTQLFSADRDGLAKQGRGLQWGTVAAFGDFDGDGRRDLAVGFEAPQDGNRLTVLYGNGRRGMFEGTGAAVTGDFDGDGRDDLAFGGRSYGWQPPTPSRIFWGGAGGLRTSEAIGGMDAAPLAAGDYDGDGDDELLLAAPLSGGVPANGVKIWVTDGRRVLTSFSCGGMARGCR